MSELSLNELDAQHSELLPEREALGIWNVGSGNHSGNNSHNGNGSHDDNGNTTVNVTNNTHSNVDKGVLFGTNNTTNSTNVTIVEY